jgi:hypothetical protein
MAEVEIRDLRRLVDVTWDAVDGDAGDTIEVLRDRYGFSLMRAAQIVCQVKGIELEIRHRDGRTTQLP